MKNRMPLLKSFGKLAAIAVLMLAANLTAAQTHTTTVDLLKGEKWWGLYVSGSIPQPFGEPFSLQTMEPRENTYPVSVLLSSNGRYIYSDEPMKVTFDGERFTLVSPHEKVEVNKGGRNLWEAYLLCCHNNFAPDGGMPDPVWFTMPQYETSFYPGNFSSQDEIVAYAERLLSEGFPPGIIVIADGWAQPNTLYRFSQSLFPDPAAMAAKLHGMGFKVMLTVTPYCSPYGKHFIDGVENGIFVTGRDGKPVIVPQQGGMAACYDFRGGTLVYEARTNLREIALEKGIDGFVFDCTGVLEALGAESPDAHEYLSAWVDLTPDVAMSQFLPYIGRKFGSYIHGIAMLPGQDRVTSAITATVSAGMTGYPYSTLVNLLPDGGRTLPDNALMAEYLLLETMMPVPRVRFAPWQVTDPVLYEAVRDAVNFRAGMSEYITSLVDETAKLAAPMVRHMEYVFPKSGFWDCDDQFMLGNHYLVAPPACRGDKADGTPAQGYVVRP